MIRSWLGTMSTPPTSSRTAFGVVMGKTYRRCCARLHGAPTQPPSEISGRRCDSGVVSGASCGYEVLVIQLRGARMTHDRSNRVGRTCAAIVGAVVIAGALLAGIPAAHAAGPDATAPLINTSGVVIGEVGFTQLAGA